MTVFFPINNPAKMPKFINVCSDAYIHTYLHTSVQAYDFDLISLGILLPVGAKLVSMVLFFPDIVSLPHISSFLVLGLRQGNGGVKGIYIRNFLTGGQGDNALVAEDYLIVPLEPPPPQETPPLNFHLSPPKFHSLPNIFHPPQQNSSLPHLGDIYPHLRHNVIPLIKRWIDPMKFGLI